MSRGSGRRGFLARLLGREPGAGGETVLAGAKDSPAARASPAAAPPAESEIDRLVRTVLPEGAARLDPGEELGRGGMGKVDAVVDRALQRRIARKRLWSSSRDQTRAARLFLREAQITSQLEHPGIVPVHDVGRDADGTLYFTMKLVEGESLGEKLEGVERPLEAGALRETLETVVRVCDALAFAHSRGVVHGDIKPDNVVVGAFGEVYLIDWGLARLEEGAAARTSEVLRDEQRSVAGTPGFLAPEQARGEDIDARTDLFLLGGLLYFCLTGRVLYAAESREVLLSQAREGRWTPLEEALPAGAIAAGLSRIVTRALAADPADRYAAVSDLRADLKTFLDGTTEFPRRRVAAGEHVVREGESGDEVFVIESGRVQVYRTIDGVREDRRQLGPGEVFGEMAILTSSARRASVVAIEDCVLRVVTGGTLQTELEGMKPWLAALTDALARNLLEREESS